MAGGEPPHRNQSGATPIGARARRAERLAIALHQTLDQLAAVAAIRGDEREAAWFAEAAALVRARQIQSDADLSPLLGQPPDTASSPALTRLRHMHDAGGWVLLESAVADLPADLRWLFESGAVTIEQLARLHQELGVTSAADLAAAVDAHAIGNLPGLDAETEQAIADALPHLRAAVPRVPLGRAMSIAAPVMECLTHAGAAWASPVGSLRRGRELVGDIEVLAPLEEPGPAFDDILQLPDVTRTLHRGRRRLYVLIDRVQVGVRCPVAAEAGAALLNLTGSIEHVRRLAALASEHGWTLGPRGLDQASAALLAETEEEIYAALGLPVIPAEIREGMDEIGAARAGRLPALVARQDMRGDLHMHTDWSDGRDPVVAMADAADALGYEYIAITDHSPHSGATRNLTADGVSRQAEEIAKLRERYPRMTILHGCEVDILVDGRLDFRDSTLERFDIVLASLHERHGHSPDQLLARYVAAMRHPLVSMITHPTNRLIPYRPGYELDYDRLFETAIETKTLVEIDGAPGHLDLDGALARRAAAAGATLAIDSDCHRAEMLDRQMHFGVMTARRGWIEPRHVINTRPLADLRAFIAAKRGR
jgi:DNA polymerase (family X)